eukprot:g2960.t1
MRLLAALLLASTAALAEIVEHRIESLPGYSGPIKTKQWSGYIRTPHVNGSVYTHYWLVASEAEDAPLVAWQQGGPGGSSLIGFFTENGPFTLNDYSAQTAAFNSTGIPTVFDNPFSWHRAANVLYVEHPAPTGFSYCDPGPCYWDDDSQAETSKMFYETFFQRFPEFATGREFYMSGESYAGVLVPTVAAKLLQARNASNQKFAPYNLRGFALGNNCPGNRVFTCTPYSGWLGTQVAVDFRFRHGMIPEDLYERINTVCADEWDTFDPPRSKACQDILEDPIRPCLSVAGDTYTMGGGYFLYDTCGSDLLALGGDDDFATKSVASDGSLGYTNDAGTYMCGQERASQPWLDLDAVREAIHVQSREASGRSFQYSTSLNYSFTAHSLLGVYNSTFVENFRILQYSGDADPCVPYIGTERWISSLELPLEEAWRPWEVDGQIAGYSKVYRARGTSNDNHTLTFATVRDAGHMVPRYKPKESLHMFERFLGGDPL